MAGASGSGQEMQTGRTNRAEGRTKLWAQVPPGQSNFNGPAILMLEVAKDAEDPDDYEDGENFVPSKLFHGLVATGWSGGGAGNFGGTSGPNVPSGPPAPGTGVLGRGGVPVPRGGVFDTRDQPQMRLVPLEIENTSQLRGPAQAGDFLVTTQRDERGQEVASLWFCTVGGTAAQSSWAKLA